MDVIRFVSHLTKMSGAIQKVKEGFRDRPSLVAAQTFIRPRRPAGRRSCGDRIRQPAWSRMAPLAPLRSAWHQARCTNCPTLSGCLSIGSRA